MQKFDDSMKSLALCGSMDFFAEMSQLAVLLTERGWLIQLPADEETKIDYTVCSLTELTKAKKVFIDGHLVKIKVSDGVLLANYRKNGVDGYIGANTLMEAAFAYVLGKKIFVLNELGDQPCRPEILGMQLIILHGDLTKLA